MNEPSVRDKVLSWLDKQGYPLEMRVASRLRVKTDLQVRQGWHYNDPETGQSREIDIVATASDILGFSSVHFAIECKASPKPWVLFTSKHTTENYNRLFAFAPMSQDAREVLGSNFFTFGEERSSLCENMPWFWDHPVVGYALAQAFEGNSDVPYAASLSAVKAAIDCFSATPEHNILPRFIISFPVVVTGSPLFQCYLDDGGTTQLREIDHGFLFFQKKIGSVPSIKVAIVSEKGLDAYIDECMVVYRSIMTMFKPAADQLWNECQDKRGGADSDSLQQSGEGTQNSD